MNAPASPSLWQLHPETISRKVVLRSVRQTSAKRPLRKIPKTVQSCCWACSLCSEGDHMARSSKVTETNIDCSRTRPNIDIHIERWPIEKLIPRDNNPRTHSDAQIRQIAASIKEFGVTNPILIEPDGRILA